MRNRTPVNFRFARHATRDFPHTADIRLPEPFYVADLRFTEHVNSKIVAGASVALLISLILRLLTGSISVITWAVLRFALRRQNILALRGAVAALRFVPSGLIGYGASGLVFSGRTAITRDTIFVVVEIASAILVGAWGALIASLLFMRFVKKETSVRYRDIHNVSCSVYFADCRQTGN